MSAHPVIDVRGLSKSFAIYSRPTELLRDLVTGGTRRRAYPALCDVTFSVRAGESLGVLGRNGAGKSTLLKLVAGTLEPTAGSVGVQGRVSAILELGTGFDPQQTGRANLLMGGLCLGMTERQVRQRQDAIIEFAELRSFIDQPLRTYSTGMVARLAFAVAISVEPEILIVDEALSVGDARFQLRCADRITELRRQGCTLLLVSHSVEQVTTMCDRALVLEGGRLLVDGLAAEATALYHRLLFGTPRASVAESDAPPQGAVRGEALPSEPQRAGGAGPGVRREGALGDPLAGDGRSVASWAACGAASGAAPEVASDTGSGEGPDAAPRVPPAAGPASEPCDGREIPGPAPNELEAGTRMGDGGASILSFSLLDGSGREARRLLPGARYTLLYEVESHDTHEDLVVGVLLRDPAGQTIYGLDSSGGQGLTLAAGAGEVLRVSLAFVNHLGPGEYFISFGVGHADGRKMDFRGDAVQVAVPRRRGIYHASRADLAGEIAVKSAGLRRAQAVGPWSQGAA
jgi:lipopolysaccharide transport system ATP-binding protein